MTDYSENSNTSSKKVSLLTFWEQEVLPRLTADLVYDHSRTPFNEAARSGGEEARSAKASRELRLPCGPILSASTMRDVNLQATPLLTSTVLR
jgi:hypothetical protein